jgi:hypothetical protein
MLRDELMKRCNLGYSPAILVRDLDGLWSACCAEELANSNGYVCMTAADSFMLRYTYERLSSGDGERQIILYTGDYLPYDIQRKLPIVDISYEALFPQLHTQTLRQIGCANWDLLFYASKSILESMSGAETERFCRESIWEPDAVRNVCDEYRAECDALLADEPNTSVWFHIADRVGFLLAASYQNAYFDGFTVWLDAVQQRFAEWMKGNYAYLSGTSSKTQPVLMNQALDYMRRQGGKIAMIVMDGMSFADFHTIRRSLNCTMRYTGMFSFVPSITSIARQSLFSGKLPMEHEKPFSLQNEEKQWREYWHGNGYQDHEIYYGKTEAPEQSGYTKVAGIILNIVDDLMHSELQGSEGLQQSLLLWLKGGALNRLLAKLNQQGFTVFLTADHGNATATAQGRFARPCIIMENASRRAAIYQSFAGAEELEKFNVSEYTGTYMPKGYRYFTFDPHYCYGDKGEQYVSHGGMTIEELIVPFVRIGEEAHG